MNTIQFIVNILFLGGAILFVRGLSMLSSPVTARMGNIYAGAVGMVFAIIGAMIVRPEGVVMHNNYAWIIVGILLGGIIGYYASYKVKMTAMPQMVAIFNGFGGACAVLLSMVEFNNYYVKGMVEGGTGALLSSALALIIGGVAFTGSMIAWLKLDEVIKDKFLVIPKVHHYFNIFLLLVQLGLTVLLVVLGPEGEMWMAVVFMIVSLYYGISFVVPIGGADMPVVICILNTFSGLSAASAGLIYNSQVMVVGGLLVGASGVILSLMMCKAMNRSLLNVLIGGFGGSGGGKAGSGETVVKEVGLNEAAIQLNYSKSVVFVPGYGLAVAQAQKVVKEIEDILEANDVEVRYAIHPVAGRMPGHMNVLLAEANVPYPNLLVDLEDANAYLANADIAVVVGANDVVNPAALDDPGSPLYGMPILRVWDAKHVIVLKRSMRPGYANIENPLFFHQRTHMLFGDAKDSLTKLVGELKSL